MDSSRSLCTRIYAPQSAFTLNAAIAFGNGHAADEFGGIAGLVTLKDLIAEIIGAHPKPEGEEDLAVQILDEQTFLVQAQMDLDTVNNLLKLNLPIIDDYQTLGGFVLYQFQKLPVQGEVLHYDNLELTVVSTEGLRLNQIRIHRQNSDAKGNITLPENTPIIAQHESSSEKD
jgi:CBS domain containing-hemolysin-like protein